AVELVDELNDMPRYRALLIFSSLADLERAIGSSRYEGLRLRLPEPAGPPRYMDGSMEARFRGFPPCISEDNLKELFDCVGFRGHRRVEDRVVTVDGSPDNVHAYMHVIDVHARILHLWTQRKGRDVVMRALSSVHFITTPMCYNNHNYSFRSQVISFSFLCFVHI
ncbi:hypothetical protein PFISCL1PPCAC_22137, partial [Pristionchus fissidentatus]